MFAAIMQEAEKETGMYIALSDDKKLYIVDSENGEKFEIETSEIRVPKQAINSRKKSRKYHQRKNNEKH